MYRLTALLCVLAAGAHGADEAPETPRPNVVVVLVDTLRADYLGLYGAGPDPADFLTGLGKESAVFDHAYSTSTWTAPSTASVFTGLYPLTHGVTMGFQARQDAIRELERKGEAAVDLSVLPKETPTLPERMKALGYNTFGVAANINIGPEIGFSRGFDYFERKQQAPAEVLARQLHAWKDAMDEAPYFCYVHLNDPHQPYLPQRPYYTRQEDKLADSRARYISEIAYVDDQIKAMYEEFGWDKNTLLMVLSDHGEEFRDHGGLGHGPTLYRELNHVLWLVRAPFLGVKPGRIEPNASLADVLPTLLGLLGQPAPDAMAGKSMVPLLTQASGAEDLFAGRVLHAHRRYSKGGGRELWSAMQGPWKLIECTASGEELYNQREDRAERNNLIREAPPVLAVLRGGIEAFKQLDQTDASESSETSVPMDQELLEELESLGYVE